MTRIDRAAPPTPAPIRPFAFPPVQRRRLETGLELLVAPHGDLPVVTAQLVLDAGAESEPPDRAGIARLTAHALETGTRTRSAADVAWELEHLGAELELEIAWDTVGLRLTVPRGRLEPALEILAQLAREPAFPPAEIERLREEQAAEILQRRKDPGALANDMAAHFIFAPDVPYARPILGTADSVQALNREAVRAFYAAHYLPNAAALLLVGDIDTAAAGRLARHFDDWTPGRVDTPTFEVQPARDRTAILVVDRPGSVQSEIRIGDVGVSRNHPDYFALLVLNTILGGAFTSRLNLTLRERLGFTYGAHSRFAFRRRPGPFLIDAAVTTEVTAKAVAEALAEMRKLRDEGATEQEVADARDYLAGVLPLKLQTTEQLAARLAELIVYRLPDDYFQHYRDCIAAVQPEQVRAAARRHLRLERLAVVVVGDAARITPELEALGIGPAQLQAADLK